MIGRRLSAILALAAGMVAGSVRAYDGDVHQQLTFIAARQYNRCAEVSHLTRLTPLEVRYVAKANAGQAERSGWLRMFRWNYYDRGDQSAGRFLWLIETRMHERYRVTLRRLAQARDLGRRFTNLGRVVNHLQDATTPAHVAPVFTTRWWRLSFADRFSTYPVDEAALSAALGDACVAVRAADGRFEKLLVDTAERTIAAIVEPIRGMPSTWQAFWELNDDEGGFGRYGAAGNNFGRQTTFPCTDDDDRLCVLLSGDPLYAEFAKARHLDAVRATVSAMAMMQEQARDAVATQSPDSPSARQGRSD